MLAVAIDEQGVVAGIGRARRGQLPCAPRSVFAKRDDGLYGGQSEFRQFDSPIQRGAASVSDLDDAVAQRADAVDRDRDDIINLPA